MTNEKMNFADLKLLEKDLHRELTDNEAYLGYTEGWKALLKHIGLTDEKYIAYRRLIELLVTYCTKDEFEFRKLLASKDYSSSYGLLEDFISDCDVNRNEEGFALNEESDDSDEENSDYELEKAMKYIVNAIHKVEKFWLEEYVKFDESIPELTKFVQDLVEDTVGHDIDVEAKHAIELIKNLVIEKTAARLAKTGEAEKLPEPLLSSVYTYIEKNWTNYSLRVVNGVISVKKY